MVHSLSATLGITPRLVSGCVAVAHRIYINIAEVGVHFQTRFRVALSAAADKRHFLFLLYPTFCNNGRFSSSQRG
ncbi:uncharacterized protein LOC124943989 isoform X2 [Impatiens glandulifera]|uniref:uncharacterized protein LOC124943989 isoform X2 n=1 Tax=Impatiens glandulifera TaxID=253017 RepID=UPI001FB0A312|nr:uncharacterized protein LOC124943989 isoform X2 [Impatiens glandulifera]